MTRYAVISTSGNKVVNVVEWDGKAEWGPGKGYTTVKLKDEQWCDIDSVYNKSNNSFQYSEDHKDPFK